MCNVETSSGGIAQGQCGYGWNYDDTTNTCVFITDSGTKVEFTNKDDCKPCKNGCVSGQGTCDPTTGECVCGNGSEGGATFKYWGDKCQYKGKYGVCSCTYKFPHSRLNFNNCSPGYTPSCSYGDCNCQNPNNDGDYGCGDQAGKSCN